MEHCLRYPWRLKFYGICVPGCPAVTSPTSCFNDTSKCIVHDYGTPAQYLPAGGAAYYYATMPSVSVMNRCIPRENTELNQAPDRCAFPQCDGNYYAPCDTEYPTLWKLTDNFPRSLQCKVKFRTGVVTQLQSSSEDVLARMVGSHVTTLTRIIEALVSSVMELCIFGVAMPIGLGIIYLVLLRLFAKTVIYLSILGIALALMLAAVYCFAAAGAFAELWAVVSAENFTLVSNKSAALVTADPRALALGLTSSATSALVAVAPSQLDQALKGQESDPVLWYIAGALLSLISFLYIITLCLARKKIKTAVALVKASTLVLKDRPSTMAFPFGTLILQCGSLAFFIILAAFLFTADLDSSHFSGALDGVTRSATFLEAISWYNTTVQAGGAASIGSIEDSGLTIRIFVNLYLLAGFLWTLNFITDAAWTVMASSVCHWFFFRASHDHRTRIPLLRSLGRVIRYHLGTIAFGSLIVMIIQLIRAILMLIDRYTRQLQKGNMFFYLIMKCFQCCMYCLEKTIKFITGYAYIYVALQGSSFCMSCYLTFQLIFANMAQLSINALVRIVLKWIQLITVPLGCAWLGNIVLIANNRPDPVWATVIIALTALVIASMFATVLGCVLDSLFVCCCRDKASYDGAHMPDGLRSAYGFGKKSKKEMQMEAEDLLAEDLETEDLETAGKGE